MLQMFAPLLLTSSFITGAGDLVMGSIAHGPTRDETVYIERVWRQADKCADKTCREDLALAVRDVVNLRRKLSLYSYRQGQFDELRAPCEAMNDRLPEQRACFQAAIDSISPPVPPRPPVTYKGVTRAGYYALRIGMSQKDVFTLLGEDGDQVSYAASGGYSAAMYKWQAGRRLIIVTFSDDEVSGYSKSGF
jgi:hypothetical protein